MVKLLFFQFQVTNSSLKYKKPTSSYEFKKWKNNLLTSNSVTRDFLCGNETLCSSELFVKHIEMLDLVIIDIDVALNRYCF